MVQGPVLLCYDGSDRADRAIGRAATLLRARHAIVVHVRRTPFEDELADSGRRVALDAGFDPVEAVGADHGLVARVLLEEAHERGASVIVVGPPVPSELLDHSAIPVLVARTESSPTAAEPVFACYDGSPAAREAIVAAAELLAAREAVVATFMPAVDDGAVLRWTLPWPVSGAVQDRLAQLDREEAEAPVVRAAEGARAAADAGYVSRAVGLRGASASSAEEEEPWMRLLRAAASEDAACIVVGHRPSAKLLESTAHGLVRHADRSVLVAPGRMSASEDLVLNGAPVALRDGSRVRIRQGRRSDGELLLRGFRRLSPESRYRRFLAPMPRLPDAAVRRLTDVDHHDHEATIALDEQDGEALGVARYVRDPERPEAAEVAVTVVDDWQGRGLGTLLLEVISARAREEGIRTFTAWMLPHNEEMMDLFERLGPVRVVDRAAGTVEIEVAIPAVGVAPELRELLRLAAEHDVAAPAGRQTTL